MNLLRIAAFSDGEVGGNPAGVSIGAALPDEATMQRVAAEVGFSETAFAAPAPGGFRVRYFTPESEVPFCGHATIALGAALALEHGDGVFGLTLNEAKITVEGRREGGIIAAALQSPPTRSAAAEPGLVAAALELFGYAPADLDPSIPAALVNAGVNHLVLALRSREKLRAMTYARNAFASSGVVEDPATGAAAAAFAGYLRDLGWPHGGAIELVQGEDMGMRSRLRAEISPIPGSSIRVSGTARIMRTSS